MNLYQIKATPKSNYRKPYYTGVLFSKILAEATARDSNKIWGDDIHYEIFEYNFTYTSFAEYVADTRSKTAFDFECVRVKIESHEGTCDMPIYSAQEFSHFVNQNKETILEVYQTKHSYDYLDTL